MNGGASPNGSKHHLGGPKRALSKPWHFDLPVLPHRRQSQVLQQQFNQFVFEAEQAEYAKEQILWSFVEFPDNKPCIEMIERRNTGILAILDEQTVFPNASDATFAGKLHDKVWRSGGAHQGRPFF